MSHESNPRRTRRRRILAIASAAALTAGASAFAVTSAQAAPAAAAHHASSPKPTIVLIHGAFADASGFDAEITKLSALGYPVYAPSNPLRGLTSDSDYVRSFLKTISGPIILVGHSYGGAVITNAARDVPNVKALVYLDAFVPAQGESAATAVPAKYTGSLLGDATLTARPYTTASGGSDVDLYITPSDFRAVFAGDVTPARAKLEALTQRPLANAAFTAASGYPAWKTIPSWDLIGTQDKAIDPAGQEFMAERAGAHITHVKSAHDVMVSHPTAVVDEILKAADGTR